MDKVWNIISRVISLSLIVLALGFLVLGVAAPAQADEVWSHTWNSMHTDYLMYNQPTNGWVTINVTNNTGFAWGDMHIEILQCYTFACGAVTNVDFVDNHPSGSPLSPDSDRSPFTYTIDNASVGAKLDYYFYSDPILTGGSGMFKWKSTNSDGVLYQLAVTPSVVPEPVSTTLFLVGAATLGFRRFRK
ncbi:MAG: PEP-CTERM sorting domain-containing protein [Nitrospiraceae bacterium]|nr:MAG: PEP-CTERM sorting domain-containing protein [Nitrospiraceae bacterium]